MKLGVADAIPFADLASNVLAVAVVLVAVAAHLAAAGRQEEGALRFAPPLGARAALAMLEERRPGAPGLSIDVLDQGLRLGPPDVEAFAPERLTGLLAALPAGEPVRLYVFGHGSYAETVRLLRASGRLEWRELSVPAALAQGGDWSPGMRALAARTTSPAAFRQGLLDLLAAGSRKGAQPAQRAAPHRLLPEPLLDRLRPFLELGILLAGFAALAGVERLAWRRQRLSTARAVMSIDSFRRP
jgi:hypothetical protein